MREQRFLRKTELRAVNPSSLQSIAMLTGYAAKFNRKSSNLGGFYEMLQRGCFDQSLASNPDVRFLRDHNPTLIYGRTRSGTLRLSSDLTGLKFEVDLPDAPAARDLLAAVNRGDVNQCSFAFTVNQDGESWRDNWTDDPDLIDDDADDDEDRSLPLRKISSVSLIDCSAVTYPAYEDTNVSSIDPTVMALGRSLWPQEIPIEVRQHVPGITNRTASTTVNARRRLFNFVAGL